ncbi:hypothetical protein HMPREF3224_02258, partial [Anaerococcus hydrogenalis]
MEQIIKGWQYEYLFEFLGMRVWRTVYVAFRCDRFTGITPIKCAPGSAG